VALIVKRTALERALEQPEDRLHALLERGDVAVAHVRAAHDEHVATVNEVRLALNESDADVTRIRRRRDGFDAIDFDLVITVGGDGTLLRVSQSVCETPVLAVNSAPSTSVGFFCGARRGDAAKAVHAALRGSLKRLALARMRVVLNGEIVSSRVLNDALYCHQSPAATSRYILEHQRITEEQKSSGMWIGTAAGSTAAQRSAGGKVLPLGSRDIQLVVREPYTPHGKPYRLAQALAKPGEAFKVRSKTRAMRLFLDGPDHVVRVDLGDVVEFMLSPEPITLLGLSSRRKE
jgi:NAD+ kinase